MTDIRQAEQRAHTPAATDRPYKALLEAMSEGAALVDTDGRVVYANPRLAALLSLPLKGLLGRRFSDWLDEPVRSRFTDWLATAAPGGLCEHTLRRPDGDSVVVHVGLSHTQESELAQEPDFAGFTAEAAHDLRSPLQSIIGFADVLAASWETLSEEDRKKFVAIIDRQARTLSARVDDVITVSNIRVGSLAIRPEPIVLTEAIDRYLQEGGSTTSEVSVSCPPDLLVRVDPQNLERILKGYVQNALTHGEPPVRIEAARVADLVQIRVVDHGPGVPPDFVPRLFGRFARANTPATLANKGLGLGLSIVRGLAEANEGHARYEDTAPNGATFIVELPASDGTGA